MCLTVLYRRRTYAEQKQAAKAIRDKYKKPRKVTKKQKPSPPKQSEQEQPAAASEDGDGYDEWEYEL
jgi:hypothetical protein